MDRGNMVREFNATFDNMSVISRGQCIAGGNHSTPASH
jgi:hypothetical protein